MDTFIGVAVLIVFALAWITAAHLWSMFFLALFLIIIGPGAYRHIWFEYFSGDNPDVGLRKWRKENEQKKLAQERFDANFKLKADRQTALISKQVDEEFRLADIKRRESEQHLPIPLSPSELREYLIHNHHKPGTPALLPIFLDTLLSALLAHYYHWPDNRTGGEYLKNRSLDALRGFYDRAPQEAFLSPAPLSSPFSVVKTIAPLKPNAKGIMELDPAYLPAYKAFVKPFINSSSPETDKDKIKAIEKEDKEYPYMTLFRGSEFYTHREVSDIVSPTATTKEPFPIDPARWFEGTWLIAPQGRGKTNLLAHLLLHHLKDACVIILDAKGELLNIFSRYAPIKDRLVFLNPDAEHPLAINPLAIGQHSAEFLEYIFQLLNTEMTTNHSTILFFVLMLCNQIPKANLETFRDIMQNGWKKYDKYVRQLKRRDQEFFDNEWDSPIYKPRRPEVIARLRALMATPALDEIFQSHTTKVDMGTFMDAGNVVLINNNYDLLGDKGAEFFGRVFIALVWAAARRRTQQSGFKRPVYFVIDEAHCVIANDTKVATIIRQCRAQNIAMIFAHQDLQSIKDEDVKVTLANCAIKLAAPTGEIDKVAPRINADPEVLRGLKRGRFALSVLTDPAVVVEVPLVITKHGSFIEQPTLSNTEYREILERSQQKYCYVPMEDTPPPSPEPEPEGDSPQAKSEKRDYKPNAKKEDERETF